MKNPLFWKKVGLDFGRTFLGFYGVYIAAGFTGALEAVNNEDFSVASWKAIGIALAVGAASALLRSGQALWTRWETPPA